MNNKQIIVLSIVLTCILIAYYAVSIQKYHDYKLFKWIGKGWDTSIPYWIKFDSNGESIYVWVYQKTIPEHSGIQGRHVYSVYGIEKQKLIIIISPMIVSLAVALIRRPEVKEVNQSVNI